MESLIPLYLLNHQFPLGSCWLKLCSPAALWTLPVPYSPPDLASWKRHFLLVCSCISYSCLLPGFLFFSSATYLIQTWLIFNFPNDLPMPCMSVLPPPYTSSLESHRRALGWIQQWQLIQATQSEPVAKSSEVCPSTWSFLTEMHSPRRENKM